MTKHLIFIYGSLRRGSAGAMPVRFPNSKFVGEASVMGSLYDLGAYPGLQVDQSKSLVIGEAYEVDSATLEQLDQFEAASNYLRREVEISTGTQRNIGWTYEPDPKVYSLSKLIDSGDWIEYAKSKNRWPGLLS